MRHLHSLEKYIIQNKAIRARMKNKKRHGEVNKGINYKSFDG